MEDDLEQEQSAISFVPCLKWVQRGAAKEWPDKVQLTPEELAAVIEQTRTQIKAKEEEEDEDEDKENSGDDDGDEAIDTEAATGRVKVKKEAEAESGDMRDIDAAYDMDNYDEEETPNNALGLGDLITHADPRSDPYLRHRLGGDNDDGLDSEDSDDESEKEDFRIKPTDNLVLVGHVDGSASSLEVYVYNDVEGGFYVHHDILLPSYPLALEWLTYEPDSDTKGNLVAVGTMEPTIGIWDLDLVDSLEPAFVLGQKKVKKSKKKKGQPAIGHTDAVLSLAWNHHVEHVLASGSVDETVLLWDLSQGSVASTLTAHKEKVQALQWHPFEAQSLLTGCCDHKARVFDARAESSFKSWKVQGEVEKVAWNHFRPFEFLVATDSGHVHLIDARRDKKDLWHFQAHPEGVNGLTLSTQCPDCLVTASSDQTLKVWDLAAAEAGSAPSAPVVEKDLKLGQLHSLEGCPDAPFVVGCGGDNPKDCLRVLDVREYGEVRACFGNRKLENPLRFADFGFATANEAEAGAGADMDIEADGASQAMEAMDIKKEDGAGTSAPPSSSGGAVGKFKKKEKKKKKKEF